MKSGREGWSLSLGTDRFRYFRMMLAAFGALITGIYIYIYIYSAQSFDAATHVPSVHLSEILESPSSFIGVPVRTRGFGEITTLYPYDPSYFFERDPGQDRPRGTVYRPVQLLSRLFVEANTGSLSVRVDHGRNDLFFPVQSLTREITFSTKELEVHGILGFGSDELPVLKLSPSN